MFEDIIVDPKFGDIMAKNAKSIVSYIVENGYEFKVVANINAVKFTPDLPNKLKKGLEKLPVILFDLANYTLESAVCSDEGLEFEAGFGEENFASSLTIPYLGIVQIIIDDKPLFINLASYKDPSIDEQRAKSKRVFSSFKE